MSPSPSPIAQLAGAIIGLFALAIIGGGVAMVGEWLGAFDRKDPDHVRTVVHTLIALASIVGLILYASAT